MIQRCFYSFQTFRRSTPSSVEKYCMESVVDLCMGVSDVSLAFLCWLCVIFSVKGKSGCSAVRVRRKGVGFEF